MMRISPGGIVQALCLAAIQGGAESQDQALECARKAAITRSQGAAGVSQEDWLRVVQEIEETQQKTARRNRGEPIYSKKQRKTVTKKGEK